jgi:hypothetical protein
MKTEDYLPVPTFEEYLMALQNHYKEKEQRSVMKEV